MVAPLPTGNSSLPHVVAGFDTIVSALDYAALGDTGVSLFSSRGTLEHAISYRELRHRAMQAGLRLQGRGLSRGDRVVLVAETSPEFLTFFYGCQYVGLVPCPVPYTAYVGGKDAYISRISNLVSAASARILCAPAKMAEIAAAATAECTEATAITYEEVLGSQPSGAIEPFLADEMAYIQFSSGSTSHPKGVPVTQKAISSNVRGILREGMRLTPQDRAFSWLPLYHDMGLVGFSIAPLYGQCSVDNISASTFARRPHLWVDLMSRNGSTITYAPTFGYRLAAQRFSDPSNSIDLSRLRIAGIGGDMVRADVLDRFSSVLEPAGFNPDAFTPSYGMAESTLLISVAHGVKTDMIDRDDFGADRVAIPVAAGEPIDSGATRRFVICGRVLTGHELIVADDGRALPERHLGHIQIRGPSLMPGYFNAQSLTDAVMRADGFMDTGDMGYLVQGEVVITGRSKDMILHKGRNVWPEDLEWAAEKVAPLTDGDVAAFGVDLGNDDEEIILLVQARSSGEEEMKDLRQRVAAAVSEAAGVSCKVVLVRPKTLTFTSSGKLSRSVARDGYIAGTIDAIDSGTA